MAPQHKKCLNPACETEYIVDSNDIDDGFCSYDCWEKVNCLEPKKFTDILDINMEELIEKNE
jgi:hypothetical protein